MGVYFQCSWHWAEGLPLDAPRSEEEALAQIDRLYKSGVPFFSKEMIGDAWAKIQQLNAPGSKIQLKGPDGIVIEHETRTGELPDRYRDSKASQTERVLQRPVLSYVPYAHLKHRLYWQSYYDEDTPPCCTITLMHPTITRRIGTHEPVPDPELRLDPEPRSQGELLEAWSKKQLGWIKSPMCSNLKQILSSSAADLDIRQIVGFSLGSISHDIDDRSGYQHALLLTLRDWLLEERDAVVPCYVQDPIYTEGDSVIMKENDVEILDDPLGWLAIDDTSIVVSIASNVASKEIVADIARPAIVIWGRVGDNNYDQRGKLSLTDPDSPRVRKMMEGYEMFEFGADDHVGDVVVYVRRRRTKCHEGRACL
ncbi:hypothetical protein N7468_001593, partial [Penicillium chermesinum]